MTAPELIFSSILGSRSDKPDQFDHTTADFQNTLQTLGLTWFGGVSATSGVAFFTSTFLYKSPHSTAIFATRLYLGFSRRYRARAPSGLAFSKVRQSGDTSVIIYIPQSSAPRVEYNQLRAPPCPKARSRLGNAYFIYAFMPIKKRKKHRNEHKLSVSSPFPSLYHYFNTSKLH